MKTKLTLVSLSLFVLTGCHRSLIGKWTVENTPELKNAKTIIKDIQFNEDKVFRANVMETGKDGVRKTAPMTGKYDFTGLELKLSGKGGDQAYWATIWWMKKLELKRKGTGEKITLTKVEQ